MRGKFSNRLPAVLVYFMCSIGLLLGSSESARAITFSPLPQFSGDVGIDYNERAGNFAVSIDFDGPGGSKVIFRDPVTGNPTGPLLSGLLEENKIATVRQIRGQCAQQWPVGTIFTGTGNPGEIAKLEPQSNGTYLVTQSWVTLPNETIFRGGFFHDRWCVAGGDLIVVSGNGMQPTQSGSGGGNVWRVNSLGQATLVAQIKNPAGNPAHLEGVITVPSDPKYGPWAGKIVTGDEDRIFTPAIIIPFDPTTRVYNGNSPKIYAITPNGFNDCSQTSNVPLSTSCAGTFNMTVVGGPAGLPGNLPHPEDFDFVEGDFYGVAYNESDNSNSPQGAILTTAGIPNNFIDPNQGDILITQEYPLEGQYLVPTQQNPLVDVGSNSGLYQIKWQPGGCGFGNDCFIATQIVRTNMTPLLAQWEHVTFVPQSDIIIDKRPDGNSVTFGQNIYFNITVTSTGPGTATNVKVSDQLPTLGGLTWKITDGSVSPQPGSNCSVDANQLLSCSFGSLMSGQQATVRIETTNAAGVTSASCNSFPNPNGQGSLFGIPNTAFATADVNITRNDPGWWLCPKPHITLTKTPKGAKFNPGDTLTFTVVVASDGDLTSTAHNVQILNDQLPITGGLTWMIDTVNTTFPGCTINAAQVLNCTGPLNLPQGTSATVIVKTINPGGAPAGACTGNKLNNVATATSTDAGSSTDTGDYTCSLVCTPLPTFTVFGTSGVSINDSLDEKTVCVVGNVGTASSSSGGLYVDKCLINGNISVPTASALKFGSHGALSGTLNVGSQAALVANMNAASTTAQKLTPNVTLTNLTSNMNFTNPSTTGDTYVINITGSINLNNNTITFSAANSTDKFVINVAGSSSSISQSFINLTNIAASQILWNFTGPAGCSVLVNKSNSLWNGTILAPRCDVRVHNPMPFTGDILANTVTIDSAAVITGTPPVCVPNK